MNVGISCFCLHPEGSHSGLVRAPAKCLHGVIRVEGSNPSPSALYRTSQTSRGTIDKWLEMEQIWFFYIVKCRDDSLYSGITNDIEHRLKEHNSGTGAKYTYSRRPVKLVYSERLPNQLEARKREIQIKNWSRIKKERLIAGFPRLRSE